MKKALDLIDDTDRLLAEADENLKALEAMHDEMTGVESKFAKLQMLVEKYEAVSLTLQKEKRELLLLFIKLLLTIKVSAVSGFRICKNGDLCRHGDAVYISSFCDSDNYRGFCRGALVALTEYLSNTPHAQTSERRFLEVTLNELKALKTSKSI